MQTVAERQVCFQCVVLNIGGLFKTHEIRKAGGNKLSNHWNVLKSALLRVTPPRLITRRDILDIGQHEGTGATTPGFAHRSRERQLRGCAAAVRGVRIPCRGAQMLGRLLHGETISHAASSPPSLPPTRDSSVPCGEQMNLFLWGVHHRMSLRTTWSHVQKTLKTPPKLILLELIKSVVINKVNK